MNTQLYKTKFSGAKLSKLAGISERQFESFRKSGLIETKSRYTLQDVIYVNLSDYFRSKQKTTWLNIKKFYTDVFGSVEFLANLPYLELDGIKIDSEEKTYELFYKNDELADVRSKKIIETITKEEELHLSRMLSDYGLTLENCFLNLSRKIYLIQFDLVLKKIIENSKDMDLKVDVKELLSA